MTAAIDRPIAELTDAELAALSSEARQESAVLAAADRYLAETDAAEAAAKLDRRQADERQRAERIALAESKLAGAVEIKRQENVKRLAKIKTATLAEIMATDFAPLRQLVDGLIIEGFLVFAAPSKTGKTFFAYQLAAAVAQGGRFLGRLKCEKAEVLYLSLEGGPRSIKSRATLAKLPPLAGIHFADSWQAGPDALADVAVFLDGNPAVGLVIIDTMARIRRPLSTGPDYATEYPEYSAWREMAEARRVAVLAITHTRKSLDDGGDFVNESYGSGALAAAANGIIQIRRPRGSDRAILKATYRDAPEIEAVLRFDGSLGQWDWTDEDPREASQTPERVEVLDALRSAPGPVKAGDLAKTLGKKPAAISNLLKKMKEEGIVSNPHYGTWTAGESDKSDESEPDNPKPAGSSFTSYTSFTAPGTNKPPSGKRADWPASTPDLEEADLSAEELQIW